ncbi:MAG TPA: DUF2460 domain-containing protein [Cellvibrio sp.]|nr:DUF2460 domain-containing protein [Cellvibrio sp.]
MGAIFLEDRLSVEIAYGSRFSEAYQVSHHTDVGRNDYKRLIDPRPQATCNLIFQNRSHKFSITQVIDVFHRCGGTFGGFRVKNYTNFSTNKYQLPPTALDQKLRTTSTPGEWQLVQWYGSQVETSPRRLIKKPVPGTVKVAKNGVAMPSGWTVDNTTGRITFDVPPAGGDVLTAGCYFDFPMAFQTDLDDIDLTDLDMISLQITLIELLNP